MTFPHSVTVIDGAQIGVTVSDAPAVTVTVIDDVDVDITVNDAPPPIVVQAVPDVSPTINIINPQTVAQVVVGDADVAALADAIRGLEDRIAAMELAHAAPIPSHIDNEAAAAAGLTAGTLYATPTGEVRVVV